MKTIAKMLVLAVFATAAFALQAKTVEIEGLDSLDYSENTITAEPGEEITIKLTNNTELPADAMSHNLVVLVAEADAQAFDQAAQEAGADNDYLPADMDDQIIAHTDLVAGGESDSVTFNAPDETGEYDFICTFPGHFAAGMKGVLEVK
ncbi:MAG TPA: plastocyanin/azurin family copper-binding protein [Wenzhouxiangella sp.]|nr:plastocyanin/azurin family copper-binding protein [Wenzhouxiangella sp.]